MIAQGIPALLPQLSQLAAPDQTTDRQGCDGKGLQVAFLHVEGTTLGISLQLCRALFSQLTHLSALRTSYFSAETAQVSMVDSLYPAHNFEEIERGFKASFVSTNTQVLSGK